MQQQAPPDIQVGVGIDLIEFDGALIVQQVHPNGPADRYASFLLHLVWGYAPAAAESFFQPFALEQSII